MKILIVTQKMNINDPVLGFFHGWVKEFSKKFESITVICLEKGACDLPANVRVFSLGKEEGRSRSKHIKRFYKYIWSERGNYEAVFVHMNQEYILLAGWLWRALGKKVSMWRNHHAGNIFTDISSLFCNKIFCTSKYSYTAKYRKTILMPVGIDEIFRPVNSIQRIPHSILFLGRIASTKNVHIFIEALGVLDKTRSDWTADIYGDALPKDSSYFEDTKRRVESLGLVSKIYFHKGIPNNQTPSIYSSHEIYVNLSSSGMYDKTIFEAMACGCLVLASNDNLKGQIDGRLIIEDRTAESVADKLATALSLSSSEKERLIHDNSKFAGQHSLSSLSDKLCSALKS